MPPNATAPTEGSVRGPATTWRALLFGLALFVGLDGAVFRSGLYTWLSRPESSGGWVALRTVFEPHFRPPSAPPNLVLFGDSRVTEACDSPALATALGVPERAVRDVAMPGSSPRVWAFEWDALPPVGRGSVVVVGLDSYADASGEDFAQRVHDLSYLLPWIDRAAAWRLAAEFDEVGARRDLRVGSLVRAFAWRRDVQDLFAAPWQRYCEVRHRFGQMEWGRGWAGRDGSLAGLHRDGDRLVGLPAELAGEEPRLRQVVWSRPDRDSSAYRRRWLCALAERAIAADADLVFVRMPTRVLPPVQPPPRGLGAVLTELAQRPRVHVLDEDLFTELEWPEFFYDALHQNRAGRARWTQLLAAALRAEFPGRFGG